jgi:hypothetical protein
MTISEISYGPASGGLVLPVLSARICRRARGGAAFFGVAFACSATEIEPRCVRLTASPEGVRIVSVCPFVGTEPAKLTMPDAGATTVAPDPAPIAMPRCWPAEYGCA